MSNELLVHISEISITIDHPTFTEVVIYANIGRILSIEYIKYDRDLSRWGQMRMYAEVFSDSFSPDAVVEEGFYTTFLIRRSSYGSFDISSLEFCGSADSEHGRLFVYRKV